MRVSSFPFLASMAIAVVAAACGDQPSSTPGTATNATPPVVSKAPPPPAPAPAAPTDATAAAPAPAPAAAKLDEKRYDHFGTGIAATTKATDIAEVQKSPAQFTGKTVAIRAPIARVCPKKGCWMDLGQPAPAGMTVKFKDYGFFVPLDAGGRTAIVEGTLTQKGEALAFEATGVAIEKPPAK